MKLVLVFAPILLTLLVLFDRMPSSAQITLWETYQSAGHQAIEDGRVADAERLLLAAAQYIETVSPDDPRPADTLNDLGVLYGMQNRDIEAEPLFEKASAINEKAFGRQHPSVVLALQNLSVIYASQNKFSEAHRAARESLEISLHLFGIYHPRIGSTCRTLATVYALEGKYEEAERFAEKSITVFENTLGERHPETAQSLEMMVRLMWSTHREREAQRLEARLNTIRQSSGSESESAEDTDRQGIKNPNTLREDSRAARRE
ncbi:MAG TPA: tetratricopeptide repeat protein [Nitrospira sp.]|nr:tetratricopeptide repeat protein [Nitrospira sp.]